MNSSIAIALALLGLLAAPIAVKQNNVTLTRMETISTNSKALHAVPKKDKVWTCGAWEASTLGGSYKRCEER